MIHTMRLILRHKDSRKRLLFTLTVLLLIQIGSHIPTYGVNPDYMRLLIVGNGALNLLDAMTGSALSSLSLFTLSITPYITASIIMQLLSIAVPRLERMVKEEVDGKEKFEKITYIAAGILGYVQAAAMAIGLGRSGLLVSYTWYNCLIVTFLWGTAALLAVLAGKQIDKRGLGNGISLILLFNIVSSMPADLYLLYQAVTEGQAATWSVLNTVLAATGVILLFLFCVFLNDAQKKIPVQYSQKAGRGNRYMGFDSFIPIKVCIAGVMPVIFASSIMSLPSIGLALTGISLSGTAEEIFAALNSGNWFRPDAPVYTLGYILYVLLMFFFAYFYSYIAFNPYEVSENLRKSGGTIAGIRPGKPTMEYLVKQMKYLIFIGNIGLLVIATVPLLVSGMMGLSGLSLGGTSIIIICGVILETRDKMDAESKSARAADAILGSGLIGNILPNIGGRKGGMA